MSRTKMKEVYTRTGWRRSRHKGRLFPDSVHWDTNQSFQIQTDLFKGIKSVIVWFFCKVIS